MHPSIIRTLSTGNTRGSFTIITIGRSIGILLLLARKAPRIKPGFKELIAVRGEMSLGLSCWNPLSTKLSIPWQPPSMRSSPEYCGVYYGMANNFGVSAPEQALTREYGLTAENACKRALALLEKNNV